MKQKLPTILWIATLFCTAIYIGVFIGRASSRQITSLPDADNYVANNMPTEKLCIDLNDATIDDLLMIPCLDRQLAENIIQYRERFQAFVYIGELKNVEGITNSIYRQMKDYVTVAP